MLTPCVLPLGVREREDLLKRRLAQRGRWEANRALAVNDSQHLQLGLRPARVVTLDRFLELRFALFSSCALGACGSARAGWVGGDDELL